MSDRIYVIKGDTTNADSTVVPLDAREYGKEEEFQDLLERFPDLLAGELVDPETPRRWLLVAREMRVPDTDDSAGRWRLDHFFVDQDGTPTLVEVKRQSDTRLRREVVGQMLDYAANAARYWPAEYLQEVFLQTCKKRMDGKLPSEVLREFLEDSEILEAAFWKQVVARLAAGDMRLIFFSDQVGPELQRIVEFLNGQMKLTDVLALEVRRYVGQDLSTHIPRIVGQRASPDSSQSTAATPRRKWTEAAFLEAVAELPTSVRDAVHTVLEFSTQPGWDRRFGTGSVTGSVNVIRPQVCNRSLFTVRSNGALVLRLGWLGNTEVSRTVQEELASLARGIFGMELPSDLNGLYPEMAPELWVPKVSSFLRRTSDLVANAEADHPRSESSLVANPTDG